MKKQFYKKIILLLIIFAFSSVVFSPSISYGAQSTNIPLYWENPNKGKNPYSFKLSDVLNTNTMMQVVGCTGVVNKVSGVITGLFKSGNYKDRMEKIKNDIEEAKCLAYELGLVSGASAIPFDGNLTDPPKTLAEKCNTIKADDPELYKQAVQQLKLDEASKFNEECLAGIAKALATKQLVSMTKSTMNWITSGFNGDPMYVRNTERFMDSMTYRLIAEEIEFFKGADRYDYPYGQDYARSLVSSYRYKNNTLDSMKQTLTNYLDEGKLGSDIADLVTGERKADYYINSYANNFDAGGWNAWLAYTLYPQNNPIGFNILASDEQNREEEAKIKETEKDIDQGNGFMSQKKCVKYGLTQKSANKKAEKENADIRLANALDKLEEARDAYEKDPSAMNNIDFEEAKTAYGIALDVVNTLGSDAKVEEEECKEWETVTPGSVISETVTNYLNSPVRQLELADTINETLSILFDNLLSKFRTEGLTSIGYSTGSDFVSVSDGFGINKIVDSSGNEITTNIYKGTGWNKPFDLKTDLGNTYIRSSKKDLGSWDAKNNIPELLPSKGEENSFYTVKTPGRTTLILDSLNNWEVGDRAFFDGEKWQNWKKGASPDLPIEKRGIIQIQQDFIASATDFLTLLPAVMPKVGELDYCIPGPNPSWQAYSLDAQIALSDFISAIKTDFTDGGFLKRKSVKILAPVRSSTEYRSYQSIFDGTSLWQQNYTGDSQKNGDPKISSNFGLPGYVQGTTPWQKIFAPRNVDETTGGGIVYKKPTSSSPGWPEWAGNGAIADANNLVNDAITNIMTSLEKFNKEYDTFINEKYGAKSLMQTEFILNEAYEVTTRNNSAYLEMAKEGLAITRDIVSRDDEINEITTQTEEEIITAKSNISKLLDIKKQVSVILNDAQKRRDTEGYQKIITQIMEQNKVTEAKAKEIYEECKKEEQIYYIDASDLLGLEKNENRCSDGLDNDLDKYIDANDKDCNGIENIDTGLRSRGTRNLSGFTGNEYNNFEKEVNGITTTE